MFEICYDFPCAKTFRKLRETGPWTQQRIKGNIFIQRLFLTYTLPQANTALIYRRVEKWREKRFL